MPLEDLETYGVLKIRSCAAGAAGNPTPAPPSLFWCRVLRRALVRRVHHTGSVPKSPHRGSYFRAFSVVAEKRPSSSSVSLNFSYTIVPHW